jgi:prophage DNA circulation protein
VSAAIGDLEVSTAPSDVAAAAQALVAALLASAANPADAIRLLTTLAAFAPSGLAAQTAAGVATSALFRRAAISAAAQALGQYQPSSSNDAAAVRSQVLLPLDAEIAIAGNTGANDVFTALRSLRTSVVQAMATAGANLPGLITLQSAMPLPALVLAYRQYGDAGRGAELVTEANPISPLFMPLSFPALAS